MYLFQTFRTEIGAGGIVAGGIGCLLQPVADLAQGFFMRKPVFIEMFQRFQKTLEAGQFAQYGQVAPIEHLIGFGGEGQDFFPVGHDVALAFQLFSFIRLRIGAPDFINLILQDINPPKAFLFIRLP